MIVEAYRFYFICEYDCILSDKHPVAYQPSSRSRIDLRLRDVLGHRLSIPKWEGYELVRAENLKPVAIGPF